MSFSSPTETLNFTSTSNPTETPLPTEASKPDIRNLVISNDDLNKIIPNAYPIDYVVFEDDKRDDIDLYSIGYVSLNEFGTFWLTLIRIPGESCEGLSKIFTETAGININEGIRIDYPTAPVFPKDLWMTNIDNRIYCGYSISEVCVQIEFEIGEFDTSESVPFLILIIQKQMRILQDAGY